MTMTTNGNCNNHSENGVKSSEISTESTINQTENSEVIFEQFVLDLFDKIAKNEEFTEYTVQQTAGSNAGDGFMGLMLRIEIKGRRQNAATADTLSIMLKMPPLGKARREQFNSAKLFQRESYMYETVLPAFVKFQRDRGLNESTGFFGFPKVLAIVCEPELNHYAIAMENLKENGFNMFNKYDAIDWPHVKLIMEELAKFHAVSFAMRDQQPAIFEPLRNMDDVFIELMKRTDEMMLVFQDMAFEKAIATLDPDKDKKLITKIENLKVNFVEHLDLCIGPNVAVPLRVIGHGDSWNNNIMFFYNQDESKIPQKICLIDFQLSRFSSPVIDFTYFLFTSTIKSLRDQHYEQMKSVYYEQLCESIKLLGSDSNKLFKLTDFNEHLSKFGKYGILMAPMLLQVITADPTEIPDIDELAEKMATDASEVKLFITEKSENTFNKRMYDILIDADAFGFLADL